MDNYACSQSSTRRIAVISDIMAALPPDMVAQIEDRAKKFAEQDKRHGLGKLSALEVVLTMATLYDLPQ